MTRVISVRGRDRAELEADPDFVYVGRAMPRQGWRGSIWGNPFRVSREAGTATQAVESFRGWLDSQASMRARISELRGKTLGCWCCDWNPGEPVVTRCHAIVLAQMADATENAS